MANITKEFLEKALGGQEIDAFEVNSGSNIGDGYASILYAVDVILKIPSRAETPDAVYNPTNTNPNRFCDKLNNKLHLLVKCFPTNVGRQEFVTKGNIFWRELLVYNTVIPELVRFQQTDEKNAATIIKPPFPEFYYGQAVNYDALREEDSKICSDPLENCIVMGDLRKSAGFKLADRVNGFDADHSRLVIKAQAKLHALSWAYKQLTSTPSLRQKFAFLNSNRFDKFGHKMMESMITHNLSLFTNVIQDAGEIKEEVKYEYLKSIERFKSVASNANRLYLSDSVPKDWNINKDSILRIPQPHIENEEPWLVLTHGDCWLNNMMFRYDQNTSKPVEVLFVDLPRTSEGDPFVDVTYNLYTNTTAGFRKLHLNQLLKLYFESFSQVCDHFKVSPLPGFNLAEVHRRFHRAKIFGFAMSIIDLPICLTEQKNIADLEEIEGQGSETMTGLFKDMAKGMMANQVFSETVIGMVSELHAEGVI